MEDMGCHITDILTAFWYNRDDEEMKALCEEIKNRVEDSDIHRNRVDCLNCHTNDGDVIFSYIIILYGEYGTSPRHGWIIKKERIIEIIEIINDFEDIYIRERYDAQSDNDN